MTHSMLRRLAWGLMTLMATAIAVLSIRFLLPDPPFVDPEIFINFSAHRPAFLAHVIAGLIALLLGPWQFVATFRSRYRHIHRWMGRIYCAAVAVGAVGGFIVAWTTTAGPVASVGFASLAVVWLYATARAYQAAGSRDFSAHRRWMIRSFALTAAAITLRLGLPIAPILGYSHLSGYIVLSWACWLINIAIAEAYLHSGGPVQRS